MPRPNDPWRRTSVVTVTHHGAAVIADCLKSVARADQIIVVDNASDDETCDIVLRTIPSVELIRNAVGVGFGNGCNQGLERIRNEFALLINPDAVLRPGALDRLVAAADRYGEAGILGPTILTPAGTVELSHDLGLFERVRAGRRRDEDRPPEGDCCADYLSGAVLLIRMAAVGRVGAFDPAFFLYYEDDDLCMRMRAAGYSLVLVAEAVAEHLGGLSTRPGAGQRWEKFWHMAWSRLYIERKYNGPSAMRRVALANSARFALKAVAHGLTLNLTKGWRDAARLAGTLAFLFGVRPSKAVR